MGDIQLEQGSVVAHEQRRARRKRISCVARGMIAKPREQLGAGAVVLRGFAVSDQAALLADLQAVVARAPFRHMVTPGGHRMSVAMTNCGSWGWVTDRTSYRYDSTTSTLTFSQGCLSQCVHDPELATPAGRRLRM